MGLREYKKGATKKAILEHSLRLFKQQGFDRLAVGVAEVALVGLHDRHDLVGHADGVPVLSHYFNTRAASIYGGSNEIQRNIIAKLVLGL